MKNLIIAFRTFFKGGQNSGIKVISLGAGLAMGLVLISKIYFEQSYDNFYPDNDRIYKISASFTMGGGDPRTHGTVSGGVAVGLKAEIPSIEAATRYTKIGNNVFHTPDKNRYTASFILADSCLFDVLPRKIIMGGAKQTLSRPMYVMVSDKIAKMVGKGDDVIGQTITIETYPNQPLTIGGVFADIPENSHSTYDIILSLSSISAFMGDGSDYWFGNDRYSAYIKLTKGTTIESLEPHIIKAQQKYQDPEILKKSGMTLKYVFTQLDKIHSDNPENKRINLILGLLAFTLLLTAIMNYILIVISSMVKRNREVAICKCYGASAGNISSRILYETLISLLFSLVIAVTLIILFSKNIEDILQTSIGSLFSLSNIAILFGVCVIVFLATGVIPSYIFSRIPISSAFKNYKETRRYWKQTLLFFQFTMTSFLVVLLFVVVKQYNLMINDNPGYTYDKTLYCSTDGAPSAQITRAVELIKGVQGVTNVATSEEIPIFSGSGNMVSEVGSDVNLFNFSDLYAVDDQYMPLMEIDAVEGRTFNRELADSASVMVSKSFADKISTQLNWNDGVIGKTLDFTEHGNNTIVGVYNDIRIGSLVYADTRPTAIFYSKETLPTILIKVSELEQERISNIEKILKDVFTEMSVQLIPYKTEVTNMYADSLRFSKSVLIGGIVVFIISMIGLIGYTNDEIIRRSKEISIRKINGSSASNIIKIFTASIGYMAIPAVIVGVICSCIVVEIWLEQFSDKVSMPTIISICAASGILVLGIVLSCVIIKTWSVANENPVKRLKNE